MGAGDVACASAAGTSGGGAGVGPQHLVNYTAERRNQWSKIRYPKGYAEPRGSLKAHRCGAEYPILADPLLAQKWEGADPLHGR